MEQSPGWHAISPVIRSVDHDRGKGDHDARNGDRDASECFPQGISEPVIGMLRNTDLIARKVGYLSAEGELSII